MYVEQPQGYVVEEKDYKVYKLKKALYMLKQAPRGIAESMPTLLTMDSEEAQVSNTLH